MTKRKCGEWIGVLLALALAAAPAARAQPVVLRDVPPTTGNSRYYADRFDVVHPSLSLNGFRCTPGADGPRACRYGYGVADVVERAYAASPDSTVVPVFDRVLAWAAQPMDAAPRDRSAVIDNGRRLQARAFAAVAARLLEGNGYRPAAVAPPGRPALPPADEAAARFRGAATAYAAYAPDAALEQDAMKWTAALTNLARALDLYLALENAVQHYGADTAGLLTCAEKGDWLAALARMTDTVDDLGNLDVVPGVSRDEVQAGNWPMKVHVAVGYAVLPQQAPGPDACRPASRQPYGHWLRRAFRSAGAPTRRNRSKHWHYQTSGGRRFFAEGPYYFHLALLEVVPFWHAARLNGLARAPADGDPFFAPWFTRPLAWLADLATPDGRTPPLDDGNRAPMEHSAVLRWQPGYGEASVGARYAWVADRHGWAADPDLLLVELAVPRRPAGSGFLPSHVGNARASETGEDGEQQALVRFADARGRRHYVLLNGESGDAIRRGEGHEQADQLQLLYYVDDGTYLADSGYDHARGLDNSTWNHYYDHNVMVLALADGNGEGGLRKPRPRVGRPRIDARHHDVEALTLTAHGRVDVLHGHQRLDPDDDLRYGPTADYRRTVFVVRDPDRPYLVDVNAVSADDGHAFPFVMRYHGYGDRRRAVDEAPDCVVWDSLWTDGSDDPDGPAVPGRGRGTLRLRPFTVEHPTPPRVYADRVREAYGLDRPVLRLDLPGGPPRRSGTTHHTVVAWIEADGADDGVCAAAPLPGPSSGAEAAAWAWRRDPATIDVAAARAADADTGRPVRWPLALGGAPPAVLVLPPGAAAGFVRLRRTADGWRADAAYRAGLYLGAPPAGAPPPSAPSSSASHLPLP